MTGLGTHIRGDVPREAAALRQHYAEARRRLLSSPAVALARPQAAPAAPSAPIAPPPRPEAPAVATVAEQTDAHVAAHRRASQLASMDRIDAVIMSAAEYFEIDREVLIGAGRRPEVTLPRQIAMWVALDLTGMSLPHIGTRFGGRDHTTVLHAVKKVEADRRTLPAVAEAVDAIRDVLRKAGVRGREDASSTSAMEDAS